LNEFVFDESIATDPYFIWKGLDPMTRLSRDIVQSGLGSWLAVQLKWIWDQQTKIKTSWYLNRVVGLCAWSWHEAGLRLSSFSKQDSFTAAEFCEFHFNEEAKRRGAEEIKNPFWNELFAFKKETGDLKFFTHLPVLVNQAPLEFHSVMRLYCLYWDRLCGIPLQIWSGEAAATFLKVKLRQIDRHGIAPSAELLSKWRERLGLVLFKPAAISKYNQIGEIPHDGFDLEAFMLAGIPDIISPA
jgi:hypothetical protein